MAPEQLSALSKPDTLGHTRYEYLPLDDSLNEIRIAELLPAETRSESVECRISKISLDSSPSYVALSYTWGDPSICRPITIEGNSTLVTTNLEAALRRIRQIEESVFIWVDAICINQNDDVEKSSQVKRMSRIYSWAWMVYVWLGVSDERSSMAWNLMKQTLNVASTPGAMAKIIMDRSSKEHFGALHDLFHRDYWSRIWVVQEVASGNVVRVFCGDEEPIQWEYFQTVCHILRENRKLIVSHVEADATRSNTFFNGGPRALIPPVERMNNSRSLLNLLRTYKGFIAGDARDKVYALVGLSKSKVLYGLTDYKRSVRDTFIYTAKHIIQTTHSLDVICVGHQEKNSYELPSWQVKSLIKRNILLYEQFLLYRLGHPHQWMTGFFPQLRLLDISSIESV